MQERIFSGLASAATRRPSRTRLTVEHPDTILHRGKIYTVDTADSIRSGQIVAIGSSQESRALPGPETRVIDLEGRAIVPGFVDGHPHMDGTGIRALKPSFDDRPACARKEILYNYAD